MRTLRTPIISATIAALALTALAAPASAMLEGPIELVVVNGRPGLTAEVCINGDEVKGKLKFGKRFITEVKASGFSKLVLRRKASGQCTGQKLVKFDDELKDFSSHTFVLHKKNGAFELIRFDNHFPDMLPSVAILSSRAIVAHAAKAGPIDAYVAQTLEPTPAAGPTFSTMKRGDSRAVAASNAILSTWITPRGRSRILAGPSNREARELRTNHYVLVGTRPANYRLVFYRITFPV